MISLRPLLILPFISAFSFSFTLEQEYSLSYQQHAAQWSQELTNQLSLEEIQLTINTLYLLHANALIDVKMRQFIIPITRLNQIIRANIFNYKNATEELAALRILLDRLSLIVGARTIYNQMLETCISYCNNNHKGLLNEMLGQLQIFGQQALKEYAHAKKDETSKKTLSFRSII